MGTIRLFVNGWELQGDIQQVFFDLLRVNVNIHMSSLIVVKEQIVDCCEIMYKYCELKKQHPSVVGKERTKYSRTQKFLGDLIDKWNKVHTIVHARKLFYDLLLRLDGKPLLRGYGFTTKFKDKLHGDAEKESCVQGAKVAKDFFEGYTLVGFGEND